jgi:hypothetical protein
LHRLLINSGRSLLAFNYNHKNYLYVAGSLAEPITAALFIIGLTYAIVTWRDPRSRLVLIWFGIGIAAAGIASKYDYVAVSRLNFVLPAVATLAALALYHAARVGAMLVAAKWRGIAFTTALAVVVGLSALSNLHRWFNVAPEKSPTSVATVVTRVLQDDTCEDAELLPLVIVGRDGHIHTFVNKVNPAVILPERTSYTDPSGWIESAPNRCVIVSYPRDEGAIPLMRQLESRWPGLAPVEETDASGVARILVYYPSNGQTSIQPEHRAMNANGEHR